MDDELKKIKLPQLETFKNDLDEYYFSPIQESIDGINDMFEDVLSDKYDENRPYEVGEYCIYDNKLYECIRPITEPREWSSFYWEKVNIPQRIIPKGGDIGQVLSKIDGTDFNVEWVNNPPVDPSAVIDDEHTNSSTTWSSSKISRELLNRVYPVGAIYMSVVNTSPATLFGGTWVQLSDRFLIGASSTGYPVNATGGEKNHTLSVAEMPKHSHSVSVNNNGNHKHDLTVKDWRVDDFVVPTERPFGSGATFNPNCTTTGDHNGHWLSGSWETTWNGTHGHSASAGYTGSTSAHNNMPPYLAVYMWKRTA